MVKVPTATFDSGLTPMVQIRSLVSVICSRKRFATLLAKVWK